MSGILGGNLIGGLIGAALGAAFGPAGAAMWGWAIGSIAGSLLYPAGGEGPRLQDLKVQSSEYGRPLPIVYGHVGIGGNVIWALDLIEESHEEGGGILGGGTDVFEYFGTFAVAVCEGPVNFGRIWAGPEKRLFWDGTNIEGAGSITFYSGTEDQEPDPLIVADMGEGLAPAYRGTAYVVFERLPLKKDGNRIPMLTFEVGNAATSVNTGPANTGATWFNNILFADGKYFNFYHGAYYGVTIRNEADDSLYRHYAQLGASGGRWTNVGRQYFLDPDRDRIVEWGVGLGLTLDTIDWTNGDRDIITFTAPGGADANLGIVIFGGVYHNGYYIFAAHGSSGAADRVSFYFVNPDTLACDLAYAGDSGSAGHGATLLKPHDGSLYLYVASTDNRLTRHSIASGAVATLIGTTANNANAEVDPYTGFVWSFTFSGGVVSWTVHNAQTPALVHSGSQAGYFFAASGMYFTPDQAVMYGERWLAVDYFYIFDPASGVFSADMTGGYSGTARITVMDYDEEKARLMALRYGGDISVGDPIDPSSVRYLVAGTFGQTPSNFYHANTDISGSVDLGPAPLDEIVEDLCIRAGLDASQVDVTQLADDDVDGYIIGNTTQVKDAILALAPAYFFDGSEFDGKLNFVKRGGDSVVTIPDSDLGASESGSESAEPLMTTRAMDDELPRIVTVKYLQAATKYEIGTRIAKRLVGESQNRELPMDLPMVLSDTKSQEVAEVNLHMPWVGRLSYAFALPRKYSYLTPTDIVVVGGNTVRLVKITKTADGRLKCEAVHDDANVYTQEVVVTETPPSDGEVSIAGETTLELM